MSKKSQLDKKISDALHNDSLRTALKNLADAYPAAREHAYRGIDFQKLREEIAQIKKKSGEQAEILADQFREKLTARGAHVHLAANGDQVVSIIKSIARKRDSRLMVKSKSMTSEEIHLNKHLANTARIVETDLGEWIIQQIGEKPSHIVMPAIHLTRKKCAEIFSQVTGRPISTDIPSMVNLARNILRTHFLDADIGITGCNAAVAETGTMVIFTNEGNARLTTTLPPVHIVIMGYEKLVHQFKDIAPLTKALPKSATGQIITSYITMISGPAQTLKDKIGPALESKELHVILLDNGRLQMLKDPEFKEVGQCLRCASCLNVCPAYELLGGQVYGHIYAGGIGTLLTAFLNSTDHADAFEALCLQCGCCKANCPANIPIPDLILRMRARLKKQFPPPLSHRLASEKIMPSPTALSFSIKAARIGTMLLGKQDHQGRRHITSLPPGLKKLVQNRHLPLPAHSTLHTLVKNFKQKIPGPLRGRIALYAGCLVDYVYPETGKAIINIFNKEGYEVVFPEQGCCGAPALYNGLPKAAAKAAKVNIESLEQEDYDFLVTPCPTCTTVIRKKWPELLKDSPVHQMALEKASSRVVDFIQLLYRLRQENPEPPPKNNSVKKVKITYHQSCHLKRSCGITEEPRVLLSSHPHLQWIEMEESDRCCGFAGSYSFKYPEIAGELLSRKLDNIIKSGAAIVAVDCPGCLLSLRGGLSAKNSPVKVVHSAELLEKD